MQKLNLSFHVTFTAPILGSCSGNREIHEEFIASRAKDSALAAEEVQDIVPTPEDVGAEIQKASTIFYSDEKGCYLADYQVKGFLKEAVASLVDLEEIPQITKWGYKRAVDKFLFVRPRKIRLIKPNVDLSKIANPNNMPLDQSQALVHGPIRYEDGKLIVPEGQRSNQRPLRASTMQGDRTALAQSQELPEGTQIWFTVELMVPDNAKPMDDDTQEVEPKKTGKKAAKPKKKAGLLSEANLIACMQYGSYNGIGQWRSAGYGTFEYEQIGETTRKGWIQRSGSD